MMAFMLLWFVLVALMILLFYVIVVEVGVRCADDVTIIRLLLLWLVLVVLMMLLFYGY